MRRNFKDEWKYISWTKYLLSEKILKLSLYRQFWRYFGETVGEFWGYLLRISANFEWPDPGVFTYGRIMPICLHYHRQCFSLKILSLWAGVRHYYLAVKTLLSLIGQFELWTRNRYNYSTGLNQSIVWEVKTCRIFPNHSDMARAVSVPYLMVSNINSQSALYPPLAESPSTILEYAKPPIHSRARFPDHIPYLAQLYSLVLWIF